MLGIIKTLVLRDDFRDLENVEKRLQFAHEIGRKTFNGSRFKVIDILGRFAYGYIAVYEFERSKDSMSEGVGKKKRSEK